MNQSKKQLKIAYFGPAPNELGGVSGAAKLILLGILEHGHTVHGYFVGSDDDNLPQILTKFSHFKFYWSGFSWKWDKWYSKDPLSAYIISLLMRAKNINKLDKLFRKNHKIFKYDIIYQFSNIEHFGTNKNIPMVIHPETHLAGEYYFFKKELKIFLKCHSFLKVILIGLALKFRSVVQKIQIKKFKAVISPSQAFNQWIMNDYKVNQEKTSVVYNPIDLALFKPKNIARFKKIKKVKIIFIGRISTRKGIEYLVELSHRLDDLKNIISLEIIGGATLWSDYTPILKNLNFKIASYTPYLQQNELRGKINQSHLMIQPSKYEPFGLTVGEGLACGIPIVATTEVGAVESVSNRCCIKVKPENLDELEAGVRNMVSKLLTGDGPIMSAVARHEAERLFNYKKIGSNITATLKKTIKESEGKTPDFKIWLIKHIYPLWFRYFIFRVFFYKIGKNYPNLFLNSQLLLAPNTKMNLLPGDSMHNSIALTGFYELSLTKIMKKLAYKNGLLVDVGANYGYYTCLWLGVNCKNKVMAFEPSYNVFEGLENNISINSWENRSILEKMAAGEKNGTGGFTNSPKGETGLGSISKSQKNLIKIVKLDSYFKNIKQKIRVLKIDTEGYDYFVLKGAEKLLAQGKIEHIFFEEDQRHNAKYDLEKDACQKFIRKFGYKYKKIDRRNFYAFLGNKVTRE